MVAAMAAGGKPDPVHGLRAKQRSVHNNYFTLPVLFLMISNHYAMTYRHQHAWAVLAVIMAAGVLIRHFFNLRHKGRTEYRYPAAGVLLLLALAVAIAPRRRPPLRRCSLRRCRRSSRSAACPAIPIIRPSPVLPRRRPASCCTAPR
jgi:uncharacterized membrane protein